jgi:predicted nucleotidyltransferase
MSTNAIGWAPANRWFAPGFEHLTLKKVGNVTIRLLTLPYFLATKFDAHSDRGSTDPRTSKDFEDIVYLLDYALDIQQQIWKAPEDVRTYLKSQFTAILKDSVSQEAIIAQLPYLIQTERFKIIMKKIRHIVAT